MYRIYMIHYCTTLPITNLIHIFKCLNIEGTPEFKSNDLVTTIDVLKNKYSEKVYKKFHNNEYKCLLCGIVNSTDDVVAVLNFDGNVLLNNV